MTRRDPDATAPHGVSCRAGDAIDRHVGARLRLGRRLLGLSQQQLARDIGLSFQQVHKYEHGLNRVSAGRLMGLAARLQVDVAFFFEGYGDGGDRSMRLMLDDGETLGVVIAFRRIADPALRDSLVALIRSLGDAPGPAAQPDRMISHLA